MASSTLAQPVRKTRSSPLCSPFPAKRNPFRWNYRLEGPLKAQEERLRRELRRLERSLGLVPGELRLEWMPTEDGKENDGEVKGGTVRIYAKDFKKAKQTLKHELVDLVLSRYEQPWRDLAFTLLENFTKSQYRRKEALVERLCNLI
jgi:hypothetical protein